jgi:hypothetical protein
MTGVLAAARLLEEAQRLLQDEGSPAAVDVVGPLRFLAELRCPRPPESEVGGDDQDLLAQLEAVSGR